LEFHFLDVEVIAPCLHWGFFLPPVVSSDPFLLFIFGKSMMRDRFRFFLGMLFALLPDLIRFVLITKGSEKFRFFESIGAIEDVDHFSSLDKEDSIGGGHLPK